MPEEVELKILIDGAAAKKVRRHAFLRSSAATPAHTQRLYSVYYDTQAADLEALEYTLRLRKEGNVWTQTLKGKRQLKGGLSRTLELNSAAPGGRLLLDTIPDPEILQDLRSVVKNKALNPQYTTDVKRTTWLVSNAAGDVEIALDDAILIAGEARQSLIELELELKSGEPRVLFESVRSLLPLSGFQFSERSKAERGATLQREGTAIEAPSPRFAKPVLLQPTNAVEQAIQTTLLECVSQISENIAALIASDHIEAAHQLRVGLRRCRSAFALFAPALGGARFDQLKASARDLGALVGGLRDLEVALSEMLASELERTPDHPGLLHMKQKLADQIEAERERLRSQLGTADTQRFIVDLAEFAALRGWLDPSDVTQSQRLSQDLPQFATKALERSFRKVCKLGEKIDTLSIEQRHELRKRAKKLRYALEFLKDVTEGEDKLAFLKALKKLQTILGKLNDAAMIEALFDDHAETLLGDTDSALIAGRLIGMYQERSDHAWIDAKTRWDTLMSIAPPWRTTDATSDAISIS